MSNLPGRIPCLDGLRGVSISLVVFSHIWYSNGYPDKFYLTGNLGVRIFFIISGFLITLILVKEIEKNSILDLKKFYFHRVFRIFPAYYFYLSVIFFLFVILEFYCSSAFLVSLTYSSNYFFLSLPKELEHTWSLAVEEQFYLFFPMLFAMVGLKDFKKILLAILFITPAFRYLAHTNPSISYESQYLSMAWNFHTNMDILASGCLLALWRDSLHSHPIYKAFLRSPLIFLFLLPFIFLLGYFSDSYLIYFYVLGMTVMNIAVTLCVDWVITNHQSMLGRILNIPALQFIGVLSYSIYLWQQPFMFYSETRIWTHFPYNFIFLTLFSLFSYYFVERTFLQYRQRIEKMYFVKKQEIASLQT